MDNYHHQKKCGCKSCCKIPCKTKCKRIIKWPPVHPNEENHNHGPTHIYVPGTYPTFNQAVDAINHTQHVRDQTPGYDFEGKTDCSIVYNPEGYVIHLAPTQNHVYSGNMSNDISFLRVEGDVHPLKGVGYFNGLGNWQDYPRFSEEYNICLSGAGPFEVKVNCNTITVKGCPSPVFDSIKCGDKLTFFHKNGKCTNHVVKKAWENNIKVCDVIPICKCVQKGEGFVIRPNVNLKMCPKNGGKNQKFLIEHRLEFAGLNMEVNGMLVTGATGGQTGFTYNVFEGDCGMIIHTGRMDWYQPNTFLTNFTINSGSHGTAMLQTFVGCKASLVAQSNPPTQFWFGVFVRNQTSVNLINDGHIDTFSSDYCDSNIGTHVQAGSKHAICKCRFINCNIGTLAEQNSHVSALPMFNEIVNMTVTFQNNETAIKLDTNSHHALLRVVIVDNTVDLNIDEVIFVDINDYATGSTGAKNSVAYYAIPITILPIPP